ncbi:hypothetical protein PHYPSEUDO_000778 [Phytophthora pseudosyringae]|uniref:Uncharacterized protein n=1 Tax=Phytophthora pseudosyringae TaxID=221518 RepID=A0A8T1WK16_9STRA|nr:hypothetical protein PHYPSEUDO_000778 [Phytophthora pseudosyringae]
MTSPKALQVAEGPSSRRWMEMLLDKSARQGLVRRLRRRGGLSDRTFVSPGDSMLYSSRGSLLHLATSPTTQSHASIAASCPRHPVPPKQVPVVSDTEHAEYLIEMQLDGRYFSRWHRFSAIARFVGLLQFQRTLEVWQVIEASSRWFYRLDVDYLHWRCRRLDEFAHALLIRVLECTHTCWLNCSSAHKQQTQYR